MKENNGSNQCQIFTNGTIYIDATHKTSRLLVENGLVTNLGDDASAPDDAEIIDLQGGVAYPGFIDSHVHLVEVGFCSGAVPLDHCKSADEIIETVAKFAQSLSGDALIIGAAFSIQDYDAWSLDDLAKLDQATGAHLFMAIDNLGHNMLINSLSLKKCKITGETETPMGGKIVKEKGEPTGMLRESAMTLAGNTLFEDVSDEVVYNGAKAFFDIWTSMGYTSIVDLMGGPFGRMLRPDICRKMEERGELPLRINYMYTFFDLNQIDDALQYRDQDTDMVRFGGLKLFVDGAYAGGQAWTTWENKQGNHGLYYVYPEDEPYGEKYNINRIVEKVNELGLNIHYHVQGDEAIQVILDAIESARKKKGKLTSRHTLIHLAFPTDEQIERIKTFDGHVVATVQPAFWVAEENLDRYYGDKANISYPVKKLMDTGVSTGMSTDYWVSPLDLSAPTAIMSVAMTGAGVPADHPPLTMENVIQALTVGSSATTPIPDTGKLFANHWADFVVYDKDLYSISPQAFTKDFPKVLSTWVGGKKVYNAGDKK